MKSLALLILSLLATLFISCDQIANDPPKETPSVPIVQLADTLHAVQGKTLVFHISDYFESDVPIQSANLYSEELDIAPLPDDSFRVAQTTDSTGNFLINAELTNSDDYELDAELIYNVSASDSTKPTPDEDPAEIFQTNQTIDGLQGSTTTFNLMDYFRSEVAIDSVAFQADPASVTPLGDHRFQLSQSDDLFGEIEITVFLRNTDEQTLSAELLYDIEEAAEPAPITQQKSVIDGQQGISKEININDYFESEASFTSISLTSEDITINALGDGRFRLSQPNDLSGDFTIEVTITNSDQQELEATLTYSIEPQSDPEPPAPSDGTLVIMPLGDSMTNDSRPRVQLWNLLENDGHDLDYVGNQTQASSIPDSDHEGVGGIKIQGIIDKAESLMQTHHPEYVALMVGTNDIAWYFDESAEEIATRWNTLIDLIFESSEPGTYILAATIPPVSSKNVGRSDMSVQDRATMVNRYNAELRSIIEDRQANGDLIILADMEAALDPDQHLSGDGVHLNGEGYSIMGTVYYQAMNKALNAQQ